jgi:hypothetical protein
MIEVVAFRKTGGPLMKRIALTKDGRLCSDSSACVMGEGEARRKQFSCVADFGAFIGALNSHEAIALGRLNADLANVVRVTTKAKLNGLGRESAIARTSAYIAYRKTQPALLLLDFDSKGMPEERRDRLAEIGGFAPTLCTVVPSLSEAGYVIRRSTSAGLYRADIGEPLIGSDGLHLYLLILDGSDTKRALHSLHDRCVLSDLGWFMVGAAGQLLERSIIDRMVYAAERLVFEGPPILAPPLAQVSMPIELSSEVPIEFSSLC